jgi:hypothetical protein
MIAVEHHNGPPPADSSLSFFYIARRPLTLPINPGQEIEVEPHQVLAFNQEAFDESPALTAAIDRLLCFGSLEYYMHLAPCYGRP